VTTNAARSIGLTGGIGCGKSTVADMFAARGASVIDTDLIAHALTGPGGAAMPFLVEQFGPACATPDGALDRAAMRARVFANPQARTRLEAILHPRIRAAAEAAALAATGAYTIFVVPLLVESGSWRERVARVLVIDCAESTQVARVMARNGLPEAQVRAIMAAQVPRQVRLAAADDVIDNDGGVAALAPQIDRLHQFYLRFFGPADANPIERL
jgi:dephospho-CoA kinase